MRRKTIFVVAFILSLLVLLESSSIAAQFAVIGGIRGGAALGILGEKNLSKDIDLRFGVEANTSDNPGIIFIGGKFFLADVNNQVPMYLNGGLVGYVGNASEGGVAISIIFERLFNIKPLFIETGIDIVRSGKLQLQVGYYF